jgi:hypothetical protein
MNYKKLEEFDRKLRGTSKDYLSMIAVGSIVTGDPYIPERSDKDIVLIYNTNPIYDLENLERLIGDSGFDKCYLFAPVPKEEFGHPNSKYAFSNKFRSKTLYGEDFVSAARLPEKKKINEIYMKGLISTSNQIYNHIINSGIWPTEKLRDGFWKEFKHVFMYLAIREYYMTENYPKTRKEIVQRLDINEISDTFNVLHSIDNQPREKIIVCAKNLMKWINSVS